MTREYPFYPDEVCDICGVRGCYDIMGDLYCPDCIVRISYKAMKENPTGEKE